jgi:hypothetical protein
MHQGTVMQTKAAHLLGFAGALAVWAAPAGWLWLGVFGAPIALLCLVAGAAAIAVAVLALSGGLAAPGFRLATAGNKPSTPPEME